MDVRRAFGRRAGKLRGSDLPSAGVVDFLDFRFYGILGMERWPTFNLADATVVVSGILLFISFLIPSRSREEAK